MKSVRAGLRDLIQLPLQGSQSGPFGFLWGLGAGGASLSRHVSRWTLASVAGFSSSLSRILTQAGGRSPRQNAPPLEELGHSGQALSSEGPMSPKTGAPSGGVLSGVRRGLVGVLVAPLQLVAQTSSGLLGRETGPQPRLLRVSSSLSVTSESVNTGGLEEEAIEEGSPVRSTMRRLRGHVLPGERFMRHAEVNSLTVVRVTGPVEDVRPVVVNRGSLLLSDTAVYVLECGGARLAARLPLNGLSLEEDHASYEIVMVADSSAEQNLIACNESERQTRSASVQVLARLDRETWHAIVPVLKERLL